MPLRMAAASLVEQAMQHAMHATCPVAPTAEQLESRGTAWILGSFLVCPCHLPITMMIASAVLAGTAAGALLRVHPYVSGGVISAVWVAGTLRGLWLLRAARRFVSAPTTQGRART